MKELSKHEMKKIMGGLLAPFTGEKCTWTYVAGTAPDNINNIDIPGSNPDAVQAFADGMCWDDDNCLGVDCPGAA